MTSPHNESPVKFNAAPFTIGSWTVLLLPAAASRKLPSRGMVMVNGAINGLTFQAGLEPDGRGSHWFEVTRSMHDDAAVVSGQTAAVEVTPAKDWPEPKIPADVKTALAGDARATELWNDVTPMARWDWLRWIASTGRAETRKRRIEVAFSKLKAGTRRPCCFNRSLCTVVAVSKNGALLEPEFAAGK